MPNETILNNLFLSGGIHLERGALFHLGITPKPPTFDFDRVEGMLLGIAIGDALGITTEGMLPLRRRLIYGEIRDYIPNQYVDQARGFPSDDTQLAFWTLEQLIEDEGFVPEHLATRFSRSGSIYGIGSTIRKFLLNLEAGIPWYKSGPESAGNGALMRIAPILVPHLGSSGTSIWIDTALAAMMTHNDCASTSACLALVGMLWDLLDMANPPDRQWWIERYVEFARDLEGETRYSPRGGLFSGYTGPLWRFVQEKVSWADYKDMTVLEACNAWYSGAYLLETIPSVLYILMRHGHDLEEAIVHAVNDTTDNDTIAAIVGACVGALHGKKAIPDRWISNLSGRTTDQDDGRIFSLIDESRTVFWEPGTAHLPGEQNR